MNWEIIINSCNVLVEGTALIDAVLGSLGNEESFVIGIHGRDLAIDDGLADFAKVVADADLRIVRCPDRNDLKGLVGGINVAVHVVTSTVEQAAVCGSGLVQDLLRCVNAWYAIQVR